MAITSVGYGGEDHKIDEPMWAKIARTLGAEYGVMGSASPSGDPEAGRVTAVAGQTRTIRIAPGTFYGHGVFDTLDAAETMQLPAVSGSPSRWDVIYVRRTWTGSGGSTTIVRAPATGTGNLPARNNNPGTVDDQPIALVQLVAGQTLPAQVIDLRVWQSNGGVTAVSDKVLQYLTAPGTTVQIGQHLYSRRINSNGSVQWDKTPLIFVAPGRWQNTELTTRQWGPTDTAHMVSVTVPDAPAGEYLINAEATVNQTSGSLRALIKRIRTNGTPRGWPVQDDLPSGGWYSRRLHLALNHPGGGNLSVQYVLECDAPITRVKFALVTVNFFGSHPS